MLASRPVASSTVDEPPSMMIAIFTSSPASSRAASASCREAPVTRSTMRSARSRSFALVTRRSTIRLP